MSDDRAAQLYVAIVQSSEQAILSTDLSGVILTWNQGAQRLFGYSSDEAFGRPVTIIFPADREDEETIIFDRICHIEAIDQRETVLRRKDGSLNSELEALKYGIILGATDKLRRLRIGRISADKQFDSFGEESARNLG